MAMDMNRRQLFRFGAAAVLTAAIAPVVSAATAPTLWADGVHDDTEALQAMFDERPLIVAGHRIVARDGMLVGGHYMTTAPITITRSNITIERASFYVCHGGYVMVFDGNEKPIRDVLISNCIFDRAPGFEGDGIYVNSPPPDPDPHRPLW